jgi:hypothetical protein
MWQAKRGKLGEYSDAARKSRICGGATAAFPFSRLREKVPKADEGFFEAASRACPHLPPSGRGGKARYLSPIEYINRVAFTLTAADLCGQLIARLSRFGRWSVSGSHSAADFR